VLHYERYGVPDTYVYISRFEGPNPMLRPSAPPNTSSKASNSVGEDSALRLLTSFAR
jgi:hypothetical protein